MAKIKCNVCGKRLKPNKEDVYAVAERPSIADCLLARKVYEAMDCPRCGCQKVLNIRLDYFAGGFDGEAKE